MKTILPALALLSLSVTAVAQNTCNFNTLVYDNGKVLISWDVVSERNVNYYSIERSADGRQWELFGLLPAGASSGEPAHFAITDNHPFSAGGYYRIGQTGTDNSVYYTESRMTIPETENALRLSAVNPFRQLLTLRFNAIDAGNAAVELYNMAGNVVSRQDMTVSGGINTITIDRLSALPAGAYLARISSGGRQYTTKLLKE